MRPRDVERERLDEGAARLVVTERVEEDRLADHASVPQQECAARVTDDERLAGVDAAEREDVPVDAGRVRLLEDPVAAHREEVAGVAPRPGLDEREVVVKEERRFELAATDSQVGGAMVVPGDVNQEATLVERVRAVVVRVVLAKDHGG